MSKPFPFTKRAIEALSSQDPDSKSREAEYSDAEFIGLKLRVSKGGSKFFQHRYRYVGRKKCLSIGAFPHVFLQDARSRVSEHKSLLARDIDPSDERAQKTNDLTFKKFCEDFYVPHAKRHKKTWQEDVYKIDDQIEPAFGKYRLTTIKARDISTFLTQQKQRTSEQQITTQLFSRGCSTCRQMEPARKVTCNQPGSAQREATQRTLSNQGGVAEVPEGSR